MVFLENPPEQSTLGGDFAWEHTAPRERQKRREGRRLYYLISDTLKHLSHFLRRGRLKETALIQRLCPRGGSILDIGCANAATFRSLGEDLHGIRPLGIEPSPLLAAQADAFCRRHAGRVERAVALDGLPRFAAGSIDLVLMKSYLEHEVYAAEVLREVVRVLKPAGVVVVKVPNAACWNARLRGPHWPGVRHPDHVNYFTPRHLRRLLRQSGFGECHFLWSSLLPTSDNMWAVAKRGSV